MQVEYREPFTGTPYGCKKSRKLQGIRKDPDKRGNSNCSITLGVAAVTWVRVVHSGTFSGKHEAHAAERVGQGWPTLVLQAQQGEQHCCERLHRDVQAGLQAEQGLRSA
jgi:hypothetical protein